MPSLSLNVGLNNGRKLPFGAAAPSGIPVASTSIVFIDCPTAGVSSNFFKSAPSYWYGVAEDTFLVFTGTRWELQVFAEAASFNTSAGQTVNFIPQTNWSVTTTITVVA
jgi:hypothetical protein